MLHDALTSTTGRMIIALACATVIAALAMRARALAPSGALAAIVVGTLVVTGGGWWSGLALVTFFTTSSALSLWRKRRQASIQQRGSRRDAVQVLANGGVAAVFALFAMTGAPDIWTLALIASLAAANADTWATEIGGMSGRTPRRITNFRAVEAGTSGGISAPGTLAALMGALLIGCIGGIGWRLHQLPANQPPIVLTLLVTSGGFLGCLIDSLLGATVQAVYRCPNCLTATEQQVHHCGTPTQLTSGVRWINNDVVNALSVAVGVLLAIIVSLVM